MYAEEVSRQLRGHTTVLKLVFEASPDDWSYTLVLDLAEDETKGSSVIRVEFSGITNLALREFGGGVTQLMSLKIEDIHEWQWSKVVYRVSESEHKAISFLCSDVR